MRERNSLIVSAPSAARQRSIDNLQKFGWKKGQSGNPSGRPKVFEEFQNLLRKDTPAAVAELIKLMTESKDDYVRLAAIHEFFDRAYGKAAQPVIS
jgi:Family of unknown function (DUF5681)